MILAGLVIITYGLILTVAPAVRYHAGSERYQFQHWIGIGVWALVFYILHKQTSRKLPQGDPFILPVIALLCGVGLVAIWRLSPTLGMRQTAWIAIAAILVLMGLQYPGYIPYVRRYKYIWLVLGLILTGLTIFLGTNPLGAGSTLWLQILGLHFQPSEPLKLLLIIYFAGFFTDRLLVGGRKLEGILPTVIIITIALLLLVFQGDLGTAAILLLIYLAMLFTSRGNKWVLWLTPLLFLAAGIAGYFLIDVVRIRVDTWLSPFGDPTGTSYQIIQSMIAIAEGDLIGTGVGLGSPGLIPVAVSDFIFSALAEELGFLGISTVILLYVIFIYRGTKIAISAENSFHRYLALGVVFYFGIQSILIIGGNIGMLPLTGVTLPFLSYGGSSLVVSFLGVLILLTISQQARPLTSPHHISQPRFATIGVMLMAGLLLQVFVVSLLSFWYSPTLVDRPENPRWIIDDRFSPRGDILDRNDRVIITNTGEVGAFSRTSSHVPLYPVVGYTNPRFGQTGIEASLFTYLRGHTGYPFSTYFWQQLLYNQPPEGLDVRLTIDLDLQRAADELLNNQPGAILLMNANSGEIITMASHPYFDAANLDTEWENLIADQSAPLLNRATQGLYPPGATLFPLMIASQPAIIQQNPDPENLLGPMVTNLGCVYFPEAPLTWESLLVNGCQNAQMLAAETIGADRLNEIYEQLGLLTQPRLHLTTAVPGQPDPSDLAVAFRGEGRFAISPLQMAMAAGALTNQGVLPGPRIVNAVRNPDGGWNTLPKLQANADALSPATALQISEMLRVVNSPYWQVISTANTEDRQPITWFVGGTTGDWQGQPIVAVVVVEDDAPALAETIGRSLMEQAIRFAVQNP
jgi:cell division protein FtsW (lipid II flippase)